MTNITVNLTGVQGTNQLPPYTIVTAPAAVILTGVDATTGLGSVNVIGDITTTIPITGSAATGSIGTVTIQSIYAVTGVSATSGLGNETVTGDANVAATGVSGTTALGIPALIMTTVFTNNVLNFTLVQGSTTVIVNHVDHGAQTGEDIQVKDVDLDGGSGAYDVEEASLTGEFTVTRIDADSYSITIPTASTVNLTGGEATVIYEISAGLDTVVGGYGWGAGTWGRNGWNQPATVTANSQLRLWKHDNFGEDLILNIKGGKIFYWDATGGFTNRARPLDAYSTNIPVVANQVLVSDRDRHVIAVGTNAIGSTDLDPLLVRFSSQEDPFDWNPTSSNTAGDLRVGNGSEIIQAVETRREIILITDASVNSMQFIGPPFTFGITQLSSQTTIMGSNAAVAVGDAVFWMGEERFYVYDGRVQPLPCTVRDYIFDDFDLQQADKVFAGSNAAFGEVFWFYPSETGAAENDRYVVYNYEQKIWYVGNLERTAWLDRGVNQFPLATTSASNTYASKLYEHEKGSDADGVAITSFIESAPIDMGDGENFTFIRRMIPDVSFDRSAPTATKEATVTLKSQRSPASGFTTSKALTVTETTEQNHTRLRGRSFGLRIESDNLGVAWRLGSPRVDIQQDGKR
jgi:hypothetical protein